MNKKSGLADSPFFSPTPPSEEPAKVARESDKKDALAPKTRKTLSRKVEEKSIAKRTKASQKRDTTPPRSHDTRHDTVVSRHHATMIEAVRKAVKEFGKEAATHRFTPQEKAALADIIYAYKRQGMRTSENELARIAINYVIRDYEENGENSVLHQALAALNT